MSSQDFVNRMIELRDLAAQRAMFFGIHSVRQLAIKIKQDPLVFGPNCFDYRWIEPAPVIVEVDRRDEVLDQLPVTTERVKMYEVKGISRTYSREDLEYRGIEYYIDAVVRDKELVEGLSCELVEITEQTLTWDLLLRERKGKPTLNMF